MFHLTKQEESNLRSQFVTSNYGGRRKTIRVFTEHGRCLRRFERKSRRNGKE